MSILRIIYSTTFVKLTSVQFTYVKSKGSKNEQKGVYKMPKNEPIKIADVTGSYEERISSKTGRPYKCISFMLSENIEKLIFLTDSEQYIFENENDLKG